MHLICTNITTIIEILLFIITLQIEVGSQINFNLIKMVYTFINLNLTIILAVTIDSYSIIIAN